MNKDSRGIAMTGADAFAVARYERALEQFHSSVGDPIAWQLSAEGRAFATRSSEAWGEANRAAGADAEAAARAVANTITFYTTDPSAAP